VEVAGAGPSGIDLNITPDPQSATTRQIITFTADISEANHRESLMRTLMFGHLM